MKAIQTLAVFASLLSGGMGFAFEVSMTDSSATVTKFKQDLGSCQCDLTSSCDNFCCCDAACGADVVKNWQDSDWCRESALEIEKYCSTLSSSGYSSF